MKLRANVVEQKIFEIEDLKELEEFLQSQSEIEQLRERLFAEFLKYADYKNAGEWNKAVRLCESLAIIGWGNHEPVEALRGQFFNGNPATCFQNKFGELVLSMPFGRKESTVLLWSREGQVIVSVLTTRIKSNPYFGNMR